MKNLLNTIEEVSDILKGKIFVSQNKESYVFGADAYVIMRGDFRLLIGRNNIALENINPKHKYTIFQYESNFIFRTYENDIFPGENEFIISFDHHKNGEYAVTFNSLEDKIERLKLISD